MSMQDDAEGGGDQSRGDITPDRFACAVAKTESSLQFSCFWRKEARKRKLEGQVEDKVRMENGTETEMSTNDGRNEERERQTQLNCQNLLIEASSYVTCTEVAARRNLEPWSKVPQAFSTVEPIRLDEAMLKSRICEKTPKGATFAEASQAHGKHDCAQIPAPRSATIIH